MKGKKGFFAIKVDFENPYNRLSWSFINRVLEEVKLPREVRNLMIVYYIKYLSMSYGMGARLKSSSQRGVFVKRILCLCPLHGETFPRHFE